MPDPVDVFAERYGGIDDPEGKDRFRRWFADWAVTKYGVNQAIPMLTRASNLVGQDMTAGLFEIPTITPATPTQVKQGLGKQDVPWYRRGIAKLGGAFETYYDKVTRTGGALALAAAFKMIPGEQPFEIRLEKALQYQRAIQSQANFFEKLEGYREALREAYDTTETPRFMKGALELVFDPINLIGWGIGAKLLASAPKILRPLVFPLYAIDEAPAVITRKLLHLSGAALKLPVRPLGLAKPHWTTEIRHLQNEVRARFTAEFGPEGFINGTPKMTEEFLNGLSKWPQDADPYSIRSVMDWITENLAPLGKDGKPSKAAVDKFMGLVDDWKQLTPNEFVNRIMQHVTELERNAILKGAKTLPSGAKFGGKRLTGEVIEGTLREQRVAHFKSIAERMRLNAEHSAKVGEVVDNIIHTGFDRTYMRFVEPYLIRPWATAHLAFVGFLPMNMIEDILSPVIGMSGVGKAGASDAAFRLQFGHLTGKGAPPLHMWGVEGQSRSAWDLAMGQFKNPKSTPVSRIADLFGGYFVRKSGEWGWAIRRGAWTKDFWKEFPKALRQLGVPKSEIDALKDIIHTEFPAGMEHLRKELASKTWMVAATGHPDAVLQLRTTVTAAHILKKAQMDVLPELTHLPTTARQVIKKAIQDETITADNLPRVMNDIRDALLEWHKFTPEGIKARFDDFVTALAEVPPRSQAEALNILRMLQHAWDTVADLPREIGAHYRIQAEATGSPLRKQQLWDEARKIIAEDLGRVRNQLNEAMDKIRPHIQQQIPGATPVAKTAVAKSVDDIFDSYKAISNNLQDTWDEWRLWLEGHFASVSPDDRTSSFWMELQDKGRELWDKERQMRGLWADQARAGWDNLFGMTPKALGPRDRELYKYGLNAKLGHVEGRLEELAHDIRQGEEALNSLPDMLRPAQESQIAEWRKTLLILNQEKDETLRKLQQFGKPGSPAIPKVLREYDKAIRNLRGEITRGRKTGSPALPDLENQLRRTLAEREEHLAEFIPEYARPRYNTLRESEAILARQAEEGFSEVERAAAGRELRKTRAKLARFRRQVERGEAIQEVETLSGISVGLRNRLANKVGETPETIDDLAARVEALADAGDPDAVEFVSRLAEAEDVRQEAFEQLYTQVVRASERPALNPKEMATLQKALTDGDLYPNSAVVKLVREEYLDYVTRLRSGQMRVQLTDKGRQALEAAPLPAPEVDAILAEIPETSLKTIIDTLMDDSRKGLENMVKLWDNPPLTPAQEQAFYTYAGKVAKHLDSRGDLKAKFRQAGQMAGEATNEKYNRFFVNYDNRSTFDYAMQRMMPFWMYESRRWPRLIEMAAKRPMLAKQFTALATDWDYGYVPTPWGFEFNPAKGTIAGGLRRTLIRDFPELHQGYRGFIEETQDWLGRGGFYFAPPFTAISDVAFGEPAQALPPPASGVLHGLAAAGVDLPWPLSALAFDSRYSNYVIDQTIADNYGRDPKEIRRLAENGVDEGVELFDLARREAALRMLAMNQASVLRYRPESKKQFISDVRDAAEQYLGVSKADQDALRRLGVPIDTIIPVSRFQRKRMKEAVPNYDAWSGSSISLRPKVEQEMLRRMDAFWEEMADEQERYEKDVDDLNRRFYAGFTVGPAARKELADLQRRRSIIFDKLKAMPEFQGIPLTLEDSAEWRQRYGSPPPIVHPLDLLLERYYSISPDDFTDPVSAEVRWDNFYEAREKVLLGAGETTERLARQALKVARTPMEQELKAASPLIRQYYGVRDIVMKQLETKNPNLRVAYQEYGRLQGLIQITTDPEAKKRLERQALDILTHNSQLSLIAAMVRREREKMRKENPEMERVYQVWLARPTSLPTTPRRGASLGGGLGGGLGRL